MKRWMISAVVLFALPVLSAAQADRVMVSVVEPCTVGTCRSFVYAQDDTIRIHTFNSPIDALSVGFSDETIDLSVRGFDGARWTDWEPLSLENEQNPRLHESNLVMFPYAVTRIEMRGTSNSYELHPIRVAKDPVRWAVAANVAMDRPKILSRDEWGADESFLFVRNDAAHSDAPVETKEANGTAGESNGNDAVAKRIRDCEEAQAMYPGEFKTERTVTRDASGRQYRWPLSYSKKIRLLVVHHTAIKVNGDARSGVERVRALYQYHAENRGWGDVGYHYLIDESGQIYEGKAGGPRVVGGHAYCNNTGTVGIAILGNFEVEEPTQAQMRSLQWLLSDVADLYDLALDRDVRFHGKILPPIVGHRDLLSTDCPGYYVYGSMDQIRTHVRSGDLLASIDFPDPPKKRTEKKWINRAEQRRSKRIRSIPSRSTERVRRLIEAAKQKRPKPAAKVRLPSQRARVTEPALRENATHLIRILLSHSASTAHLDTPTGSVSLSVDDGSCNARRIDAGNMFITISSWEKIANRFRGVLECRVIDGKIALINELPLEEYLAGLAEEPDSEPYEKQRAFAIAARTYAAHYMDPAHRKFPGKPYDGSDSPAVFQSYGGVAFEEENPRWVDAVRSTAGQVLMKDGRIIRAPYFSSDDGRTRTPAEAGWNNFPFAEIFTSKPDPWCEGQENRGHGVGMSGCGARGQAIEGKSAERILEYYYPATELRRLPSP